MKRILGVLLSIVITCGMLVMPVAAEENQIPLNEFGQNGLADWFLWLPMNLHQHLTYKDELNIDPAQTLHEMFIPFSIGRIEGDEYNSVLNKYGLNVLCAVYHLDEVQQTFNSAYNTDIDLSSLNGMTLGSEEFIFVRDNYFIIQQSPHGNESMPCAKNGIRLNSNSEYWTWYYGGDWGSPDLIYTIVSYKNVAGYNIKTIDYMSFSPPGDDILAQYGYIGFEPPSSQFVSNIENGDVTPITVTLNDEEIQFDQPPIIQNDRTLVPMRAIFEAMGCDVYWNSDSQEIDVWRDESNVLTLWIDNNEMWTENGYIILDVAPQIINERTLVPVRAISESIGAKVSWRGNEKLVNILYYPPYSGTTPQEYYYRNQSDIINFGYFLNDNPHYADDSGYSYTYDSGYDIDYCIRQYLDSMTEAGFECSFIKDEHGGLYYSIEGENYNITLINDYMLDHIDIYIN